MAHLKARFKLCFSQIFLMGPSKFKTQNEDETMLVCQLALITGVPGFLVSISALFLLGSVFLLTGHMLVCTAFG
jgi:hypothetical protein